MNNEMDEPPPANHPSDSSSGILTDHHLDDDDLSLPSTTDYDPFDCQDYKLLNNVRGGRNIVQLLWERSCHGQNRRRVRWTDVNVTDMEVEDDGAMTPIGNRTPVILSTPTNGEGGGGGYVCCLSPPPHRTGRENVVDDV
jgi:hypothetical protein